ncbi:MAG TPA: hypothetical protein VGR21_05550, partial [Cryptosporangiaceae bacterium]|nr:hypothetical protein [Cryptosporangiaceae bacterium]
MNLTVGPEPPAVYWRRRALVGVPVLVVLLTFTACVTNSGGEGGQSSVLVARSTASPTPSPTADLTDEECTAEDPCAPPVGSPTAESLVPTQSAVPPVTTPSVAAPAVSAVPARPTRCADAE